MSLYRCSICGNPVGFGVKVKGRGRVRAEPVPNGEGGYDHADCANPTAEEARLREILGPHTLARQNHAANVANELGREAGHVTRLELIGPNWHWVCSCGMRSREGYEDGGKSELNARARAHKRDAWVNQPA